MSLRSKFLPVLSLTFAVAMFATFSIAQDTTPSAPVPSKADKVFKGGRDKMAQRAFGGRHGKRGALAFLRGINLTDDQKAIIEEMK